MLAACRLIKTTPLFTRGGNRGRCKRGVPYSLTIHRIDRMDRAGIYTRRSRSLWDHHSRTRRGLQSRLPFNSYVCSCSFRRNILEQDKRAALTDHCRGVYRHSIGMGGNLVGYRISEEGGFFYIFWLTLESGRTRAIWKFILFKSLSLLTTRIGVGKKDNLLAFFKLFDNDYAIIPFFSSSCIRGIG